MITREDLTNTIKNNLNDEEVDKLLDRIEQNKDSEEIIFHYLNETALIYDTCSDKFVSWYKITHIGRCLETNITDIAELDMFITEVEGVLND